MAASVRNANVLFKNLVISRVCLPPCMKWTIPRRSCSTSSGGDDNRPGTKKSHLNLAKPPKKRDFIQSKQKHERQGLSSGDELQEAVHEVAKSLGGDVEKTESDLLSMLRKHSEASSGSEDKNVQSIISSMEVERGRGGRTRPRRGRPSGRQGGLDEESEEATPGGVFSRMAADFQRASRDSFTRKRSGPTIVKPKLFEGPSLGIFTKSSESKAVVEKKEVTLFDKLEEEEKKKAIGYPPQNAFEEMSEWTKQGKMWKFPIDNEQDWDSEANVGFHEHVFLEHRIADFPKTGPIRHFMELVCVGLSKNPYLTVQEKHEHLDWYRHYFKEKQHIMDEILANAEQVKEKQQQALGSSS